MTDASDLTARIEALEREIERTAPPATGRRTVVALLLATLIGGFLLVNLSLALQYARLTDQRNREHQFWILCQKGSTPEDRERAFLQLASDGHAEWRSARMHKLEFTEVDLPGAQLQWVDLEACKLPGANLAGANLDQSIFRFADLSGSNLNETTCVRTDFFKSTLSGAQFKKADLSGSSLEQAKAADAVFLLAVMTGVYMPMCDLTGADLTLTDLREADLTLANLTGANLFRTKLAGAKLDQADLTDSRWWRADGLTPDMVSELQKKFPPTENSKPRWREDYGRWLARRNATSQPPAGDN